MHAAAGASAAIPGMSILMCETSTYHQDSAASPHPYVEEDCEFGV